MATCSGWFSSSTLSRSQPLKVLEELLNGGYEGTKEYLTKERKAKDMRLFAHNYRGFVTSFCSFRWD